MGWLSVLLIGLFWIAVIVAILFLIRWLIVSARHRSREAGPTDSALEILKIRYAKGEINKEEFEQKKKDLGYPSSGRHRAVNEADSGQEDRNTMPESPAL